MMTWRVIYPCGNRKYLAVAQVRDYETSDWDIASRREFHNEASAREYMIELAGLHGLEYEGEQNYLD